MTPVLENFNKKNYYEVLGIARDAEDEKIKEAAKKKLEELREELKKQQEKREQLEKEKEDLVNKNPKDPQIKEKEEQIKKAKTQEKLAEDREKNLKEVEKTLTNENERKKYDEILKAYESQNQQKQKKEMAPKPEPKSIILTHNQDNALFTDKSPLKDLSGFEKAYKKVGQPEKFEKFKEFANKQFEGYKIHDLDDSFNKVMKFAENRAKDTGDLKFVGELLDRRKKDFEKDLENYQDKLYKKFKSDMKDSKLDKGEHRDQYLEAKKAIKDQFKTQKDELKKFLDEQVEFLKQEDVKKEFSKQFSSDYAEKLKSGKPFNIGDKSTDKKDPRDPITITPNKDGSLHVGYPQAKKDQGKGEDFWSGLPGMQPRKPRPISSKDQLKEYQALFATMKKNGEKQVFVKSNLKDSRALLYAAAMRAGYDPKDIKVGKYQVGPDGKALTHATGIPLNAKEEKYREKKVKQYMDKMEKEGLKDMDKYLDSLGKGSDIGVQKQTENEDEKKKKLDSETNPEQKQKDKNKDRDPDVRRNSGPSR